MRIASCCAVVLISLACIGAEYYVNDGSTTGDVYCTAPGLATNSGTDPGHPKAALVQILSRYQLRPGDTVYVDTGTYIIEESFSLTETDDGSDSAPVLIQGAPGPHGPASIFVCPTTERDSRALTLSYAENVILRDCAFTGGEYALHLRYTRNCLVENCRVSGASHSGLMIFATDGDVIQRLVARDNEGKGIHFSFAKAEVRNALVTHNQGRGVVFDGCSGTSARLVRSTIALNGGHEVVLSRSSALIEHNIVVSTGFLDACLKLELATGLASDYNDLVAYDDGTVGADGIQLIPYRSLGEWQRLTGCDLHSLSHDPLFADADNGDFHLRSLAGRRTLDGTWTTDDEHSPCIDAGDPADGPMEEPAMNGGRLNLGAYAGTSEASLSREDPWVLVVSMNRPGDNPAPVVLRWNAGNLDPASTVRLEFSPNRGDTWRTVADEVPAYAFEWPWDPSSAGGGSPVALWRVVSETEPGVSDLTDFSFSIRPFLLYVNDAETAGDVYCEAPGDDDALGVTPQAPKATLQSILDAYDLNGGDVVYLDTGYYEIDTVVFWDEEDGGSEAGYVSLLGSPNRDAGGSRIHRPDTSSYAWGLRFRDAAYIRIADVDFSGGNSPISFEGSSHSLLERMEISNGGSGMSLDRANHTVCRQLVIHGCSGAGLYLRNSSPLEIRNCLIHSNDVGVQIVDSASPQLEHVTLAFNHLDQLRHSGRSTCTVRNSILFASGAGSGCVHWDGYGSYVGEYNDLYATDGAHVGRRTEIMESLSDWIVGTGRDATSCFADPLWANPENGDYHLMSRAGRYDPSTGTWVTDGLDSPCLDRGDPESPFDAEPQENGSRANVGLHGNTSEASKSPEDLPPWVQAVTLNSGGNVEGIVSLQWIWGNLEPGRTLTIEYSADGGESWATITSGVSTATGEVLWDTEAVAPSPLMMWRVVDETDPRIADACETPFVVRNGSSLEFYVNDASTDGDVFCSAPGSPEAHGLTPSHPMDTLGSVITRYDIEPGDTVHIDAGSYFVLNTTVIGPWDSGTRERPVILRGAGTHMPGGTLLHCLNIGSGSAPLRIEGASGIHCESLLLRGGGRGIDCIDSADCAFDRLRIEDSLNYGIRVQTCEGTFRLTNVEILDPGADGIIVSFWQNPAELETLLESVLVANCGGAAFVSEIGSHLLQGCTMISEGDDCVRAERGNVEIRNSILSTSSSTSACISVQATGAYDGNFNDLWPREGALTVNRRGEEYPTLEDWESATGREADSLSIDPLFADPTAGNFRLKSLSGRWADAEGWVTDSEQSPCIDLGDPSAEWLAEPEPSGGRRNLGAYGNTEAASRSGTTPWIVALSHNQGGMVGPEVWLRWAMGNLPPGASLRIDYSTDNATTWATVQSGIPAQPGAFGWDVQELPASLFARYRLVLEADEGILDANETPFVVRNGQGFGFYINDASTANDVYCTAPGNDANLGTTPASPKRSPLELLRTYDLEPGDVVSIDAGTYRIGENLLLDSRCNGTSNAFVTVRGTPHTMLDRSYSAAGNYAVEILGAEYVAVSDLSFVRAYHGVHLEDASNCVVQNIRMTGAGEYAVCLIDSDENTLETLDITRAAYSGIYCESSQQNTIVNSKIRECGHNAIHLDFGSRVVIVNCTLARNFGMGLRLGQVTGAHVVNTIFSASGEGSRCILWEGGNFPPYTGDYNCYFTENAAIVAEYPGTCETLAQWRIQGGGDAHSLAIDPLFVDIARGDFHLRSAAADGTYSAATGTWRNYPGEDSPCIDAGDLASPFEQEPPWNGGRVNMGAYGNTPEASRSYDTDNDGLSDVSEIYGWGSSPFHIDTDGDTLSDPWEALTSGTHPGKADTDGDRLGDYAELRAGTDPLDPASVLRIEGCVCIAPDLIEITWPSVGGRSYRVMVRESHGEDFRPLGDALDATPPVNTTTVSLDSASTTFIAVTLVR